MNRKNKPQTYDAVIAGGGIAGLALAVLLANAGLCTALIEKFPPKSLKETSLSARTIALMDSSLNIIKATGVWPLIENHTNPIRTMRIMDASVTGGEKIDQSFPANEIGLPQFGFNIPNSMLRAALFEQAQKNKNIDLFIPREFSSFEEQTGKIDITLDNGQVLQSRLLIGADGRKSAVREAANIDSKHHTYNQTAITCIIEHEKSHNDTATEFHRPGGPFALVPLAKGQSSVVWVETTDRTDQLIKLKKDDFQASLQKETHNLLGKIKLASNPESWPLSTLKADKLTGPRIALIAEAAHVMSPITAQGLNLSLRDVAALAETIIDAMRLGLDHGTAPILDKYARRRALDVDTRTFGVDAMNRIVSQDLEITKKLRRTGLNAVSAIPPIKKFAMRQGLAPQIDMTRLARGEKL